MLAGFGLSTVCCIPYLIPLISPRHLTVYHLQGPASRLFVPALIYFGGFWLLFTAVLWVGQRSERVRAAFWTGAACMLPWFLAKSLAVFTGTTMPPGNSALLVTCGVAVVAVVAVAWREPPAWMRRPMHAAEVLFSLAAVSGVVLVAETLWCFYGARDLTREEPLRADGGREGVTRAAGAGGGPRVIWIVLDELSYEQTFERRFPGLKLPGFDRLAAESVVFSHVVPAGIYTENVLPALMTGLPVESIVASADGRDLTLETGRGGEKVRFDQHDTVFSDALAAGYTTGVAGWYNPYCRILPEVLDRCVWVAHHDRMPGGFRTDERLGVDLLHPFLWVWRAAARELAPGDVSAGTDRRMREEHIAEVRELSGAAERMLADRSTDFLLLHMAAPHPDGIWDRKTGRFTDSGTSSYVDNLALADRLMSQIEDGLRRRGEWDGDAVIVMGDHSWRTRNLWKGLPGWTAEDERASNGGRYDDRPAYLVKMPGEEAGATVKAPFRAMRTRALLDGIEREEIRSAEDLEGWAEEDPAQ